MSRNDQVRSSCRYRGRCASPATTGATDDANDGRGASTASAALAAARSLPARATSTTGTTWIRVDEATPASELRACPLLACRETVDRLGELDNGEGQRVRLRLGGLLWQVDFLPDSW